jgi:sugar lactone lactonase YvrE
MTYGTLSLISRFKLMFVVTFVFMFLALPAWGTQQSSELIYNGSLQPDPMTGLNPSAVAIDTAGNLYVADPANKQVLKRAPDGTVTTVLSTGLTSPSGLAVDASGNLFIADNGTNQVWKMPSGGGALVALGSGWNAPGDIACDAAGNIFVADTGNSQVVKVAAGGTTGTVVFSGHGNVNSIDANLAGDLYVVDLPSQKIWISPASGGSPTSISVSGWLSGIAVDRNGNMFSAYGGNTIVEITPAGHEFTVLPYSRQYGNGPGGAGNMRFDGSGNLYLADPGWGFSHVVKLAFNNVTFPSVPVGTASSIGLGLQFETGIKLSHIDAYSSPDFQITDGNCVTGHSYSLDDNCWIGLQFAPGAPGARYGRLVIRDDSGTVLKTLYVSGIGTGPAVAFEAGAVSDANVSTVLSSGLASPAGVAIDVSGNIYVTDSIAGTVTKIPAGGGAPVSIGSGWVAPYGVAVDPAGNVYVGDGTQVFEVFASGGQISVLTVINPVGLALDASGNLLVAEYSGGRVLRLSADKRSVYTVASGLNGPQAVAIDAAGNTYVAETDASQITMLPLGGGSPKAVISGLNHTAGVAVDAAGNVYGAGHGDGTLMMLPAGASTPVTLATGLNQPYEIALDASGNLYIAEQGAGRLAKLTRSSMLLKFNDTAFGNTSADSPKIAMVRNIGNQPLNITGVAIDTGDPNFGQNNYCGGTTLAAGGSCMLLGYFAPQAVGSLAGYITLTDNALNVPSSTQTVNLAGNGLKAPQTIYFSPFTPVTYGKAPIALAASTSAGLTVSYSIVSGPGTLADNLLTITGAGSIVVQADQAGNGSYLAATGVQQTLVVNKAVLTIKADTIAVPFGTAIPPLTATTAGFVNGENSSVLSGAPVLLTSAQQNSPIGDYPILMTQGTLTAANYSFVLLNSVVAITAASQTTLSVTPASGPQGQVITMTAAVSQQNGSVTFLDGTRALGTVQMVGANPASGFTTGTATLKMILAAGTHSITAAYNGTGNYILPSKSAAQPVSITAIPEQSITSETVQKTPWQGLYNDFTANIFGFGTALPTGQVVFTDTTSGAALGTLPVVGGGQAFQPQQTVTTNSQFQPTSVLVGDFNGDGIPDLVSLDVHSGGGLAWVQLGDPAHPGQYLAPLSTAVNAYPVAMVSGDFNRDGLLDLAVVNNADSTLSILLGNGNGTFTTTSMAVGSHPTAIVTGDFNGDGILDLAVLNEGDHTISVLLGNGNGAFTASVTIPVGHNAHNLAAADFNKDGWTDLVIGRDDSDLTAYFSNGDGTFAAPATISTGGYGAEYIAAADVDGDGNPDIVYTESGYGYGCGYGNGCWSPDKLIILRGNGDGTFQAAIMNGFGAAIGPQTPLTPVFADIDGDGTLDAVIPCPNINQICVLYFDPANPGHIRNIQNFAVGGSVSVASTGDLNGDGTTDVVVSNDRNLGILTNGRQSTVTLSGTPVYGSGTHLVQASYIPDGSSPYIPSSATVPVTNTIQADATLTLANIPADTVPYGTSSSVQMTVSQPAGTPLATGTLTYWLDGAGGTGNGIALSGGSATVVFGALAGGNHSVTVSYSGDAIYAALGPVTLGWTVVPAAPTISWSPASIHYGTALGSAQLNATAQGVNGSSVAGTFAYTPPSGTMLSAGHQPLSVTFTPTDSNYAVLNGTATLVVDQANLLITANNASKSYGAADPVYAYTPTGFVNGETASVINGAPTFSVNGVIGGGPRPVGSYTITPSLGTLAATNYGFTFASGTLGVTKADTNSAVAASSSSIYRNAKVTLTATVARVGGAGGGAVPSGTATFLNGATTLGTGALNASGSATLDVTTLPAGADSITISYAGDGNYNASVSQATVVNMADASATISPNPIVAAGHANTSATITVTAVGGLKGSLSFACTGLPALTSCTFNPVSLSVNGNGSYTTQLTVNTGVGTTTAGLESPARTGRMLAMAWLSMPVAGLVLLRGRSRRQRLLIALLLAATMIGAVACGSSSTTRTKAGTYQASVTVTMPDSTTRTVPLTLTVN